MFFAIPLFVKKRGIFLEFYPCLYFCVITPPLGCFLAGYYINHVAEDVLDTLHARSVVIESKGKTAAIIEIDSCEFPDDLHDAVTNRIFEYT